MQCKSGRGLKKQWVHIAVYDAQHVIQCGNKEGVMHEACQTSESFKNKNDNKQMGKLH